MASGYSLFYIVYPLNWVIPVAVLISIMTFFSYKYSDKKKKIYFVLISIVTFALKMLGIFSNSYGDKLYLLPQILAHKWVAILVSAVISLICYSFGYRLYKEDLEGMPINKFTIALVIDTVLTVMIFVPLLYYSLEIH